MTRHDRERKSFITGIAPKPRLIVRVAFRFDVYLYGFSKCQIFKSPLRLILTLRRYYILLILLRATKKRLLKKSLTQVLLLLGQTIDGKLCLKISSFLDLIITLDVYNFNTFVVSKKCAK